MIETTVIDAHAFLWFLDGSEKLSTEARRRLSDPEAKLLIPSIAATTARALADDPSVVLLTCDATLRAANIIPTVW